MYGNTCTCTSNISSSYFQFGQTVAHRAAVLGCVMSVSVLIRFGAKFDVKDKSGRSALDLARLLSNRQCYEIASGKQKPLEVTETPSSNRGAYEYSVHEFLSSC